MSPFLPPPRRWRRYAFALLPLALCAGLAAGIGAYTFVYARGASYMTNDPAACVNCHVMNPQFTGWQHSSHRNVAVCNDCHAPHDLIGKYMTKAINGWHHSLAFTTGNFHEPIRITPRNRRITQEACRSCHANVVQAIDHGVGGVGPMAHALGDTPERQGDPERDQLDCLRCHSEVGHRD